MTARFELGIDKQGRMSVGRLGLTEGYVVATALDDGSGWVIRPAELLTQAELDIRSRTENVDLIERGLADIAADRTQPRYRRRLKPNAISE